MKKKWVTAFTMGLLFVFQLVSLVNCGGTDTNSSPAVNLPGVTTPLNSGSNASNVMAVSSGNCGINGYLNEPCVSVTICQPGTSNCTTVPNILLDTGSYGLRVFGSTLGTTTLTQITAGVVPAPVVECAQFGSGSTWGPVQSADVGLGGEPRVNVPIQVINSSFSVPNVSGSPACSNLQLDPSVGYNGILGVGVLLYDCGSFCVTNGNLGVYFKCPTSSSCVSTALPLTSQIVNPVGVLPVDNNGVILSFPTVSFAGVASENGTMTIGIGTQSNNKPGSLTVFNADQYANFTTTYKGVVDNESFIDSGSNALYFPDSAIIQCTTSTGFFCPTSQLSLSAIQKSQTTSMSTTISFYVGNTDKITAPYNAPNGVLNNIGGDGGALQFDWGFPFFLGRTIYVGIETKSSSLASGPYWAY